MTPFLLRAFQVKNQGTEMVRHWPKITQLGYKPRGPATESGLCEVERTLPMESGNLPVSMGSLPSYLWDLSLGCWSAPSFGQGRGGRIFPGNMAGMHRPGSLLFALIKLGESHGVGVDKGNQF